MLPDNKPHNILFINSIDMYGGGEVWMITIMQELIRRGHSVYLICKPESAILNQARRKDIDVLPLKIKGDLDPVTIFKLAIFLIRNKIDVILTNTDKELRFGGIAAKITRVKAVICRKGIDYPLKNKLHYRFTYNRLATVIVANSEATKNTMLKNAPWLRQERIQVIYNGVDPVLYTNEETRNLREEFEVPSSAPLLGFVGRLNEQKGIVYLLEAFFKTVQQIPDAHLLIVGDGDLREFIETFVQQKEIKNNIRALGFRNDIPNIMRTIDALILPSLWEGFGIVLAEAMAAGKPCITTRISSMPEIVIDGETGFIVPPKNSPALADAMIKLISNKEMAERFGNKGYNVVNDKFTLEKMTDKYEKLFYEQINT